MAASGAMFRVVGLVLAASLASCTVREPLDTVAETYVGLAIALDGHDPGYVDVYLGPARPELPSRSLESIEDQAGLVLAELEAMPGSERHRFLEGQRVRILRGEDTTFDDEARALNV